MLWEAITELLSRARVRVGDVASIVGLLVWLFLVRRPLLSIFHSIFAFARRPASLVTLWWPSARTELRAARDLLPLIFMDLRWRFLNCVICQDAQGPSRHSPGGVGLNFAVLPPEEIFSVGMSSEPGGRAKVAAETIHGGVPAEGKAPAPVFLESWKTAKWHDLLAVSWRHREHINVGEMRGILLWLEFLSRVPAVFGSRVLCLTDSGVACGAAAKGRSPSWRLNGLLRRRMALEVACNISLVIGWVSSHLMPSDFLSRHRHVRGLMVGIRNAARFFE